MLQLIIGISLGIILLFVILLLITEVTATYPVWKHFNTDLLSKVNDQVFKTRGERNSLKLLLLVVSCLLGFCIVAFLIGSSVPPGKGNAVVKVDSLRTTAALTTQKQLSDSIGEHGLFFSLEAKWEDGKLYGNNRVSFLKSPVWSFADWRYSLLDADGFLIKEFRFALADFVFETKPGGRITGLLNRFNAEMTIKEFQRIEKLQVVLDKKVPLLP